MNNPDYIMNNLSVITYYWLSHRKKNAGSIYSLDATSSMENLLVEQNRFTNLTVTSVLLDDQSVYEKNKEEWAFMLAESRVETNTPIHEVLQAVSNARKTYCKFIDRFVNAHPSEISNKDILNCRNKIHLAFDELMIKFSETYYNIMNETLKRQENLINQLGANIILINPLIAVLQLIGDINQHRAETITEIIPEKCIDAGITQLFIDLSGALITEPLVIHKIHELTNVLALLGTKSTITGIRPEFAQASNEMGISFTSTMSFSSLQLALKNILI